MSWEFMYYVAEISIEVSVLTRQCHILLNE